MACAYCSIAVAVLLSLEKGKTCCRTCQDTGEISAEIAVKVAGLAIISACRSCSGSGARIHKDS